MWKKWLGRPVDEHAGCSGNGRVLHRLSRQVRVTTGITLPASICEPGTEHWKEPIERRDHHGPDPRCRITFTSRLWVERFIVCVRKMATLNGKSRDKATSSPVVWGGSNADFSQTAGRMRRFPAEDASVHQTEHLRHSGSCACGGAARKYDGDVCRKADYLDHLKRSSRIGCGFTMSGHRDAAVGFSQWKGRLQDGARRSTTSVRGHVHSDVGLSGVEAIYLQSTALRRASGDLVSSADPRSEPRFSGRSESAENSGVDAKRAARQPA